MQTSCGQLYLDCPLQNSYQVIQSIRVSQLLQILIIEKISMKSTGLSTSKRQFCISFIQDLMSKPQFKPFLHFDNISFGFYDVQFITKHSGLSMIGLREQAKTKKNFSYEWFTNEIKKIFMQIGDYVLLDDPLQHVCQQGFDLIKRFQVEYHAQYKNKRSNTKKAEDNIPKMQSIQKQLQMCYYLKNYESDEQIIRKIGEVCQILEETEQQFIIKFDSNTVWESIIDKH